MAFATSAPGCLFFGLGGQQRRQEAISGARDGGWPAGTAVVPVRSSFGLLGLGWRPIGRHRRRPDRQLAAAGTDRDAGRHSGGRAGQTRCAGLCQHPPDHARCRCAAAAANQCLRALILFCDILLKFGVHAGMLEAVLALVAGLTRLETADLRCGGAAAGVAVALGRLGQWGRLARQNSGGTVGSVGFGSVGRARRWRQAGCQHWRRPAAAFGGTGAAATPPRLPLPAARPLCCFFSSLTC